MKWRLLGVVLVAVSLVLAGSDARAQLQSKDQQKCIYAINKDAIAVAKVLGREAAKCIKDGGKGKLSITAQQCLSADSKGRVEKKEDKTISDEARKCTEEPPDYGYTSAATANAAAQQAELDLFEDMFGADLDAALINCDDSKDGCKCQQTVAKFTQKLAEKILTEFRVCKKTVLQNAVSGGDLQGCVDDPSTERSISADSKGRIAKAAAKLQKQIGKRCDEGVTASVFPGTCDGLSGEALSSCLEASARCRTCEMINAADNSSADCDVLDNGSADASCSSPDPTPTPTAASPSAGYNLFSSLMSTTAYLMDNNGNFVHSWATGYAPGQSMYLLEDGDLLHTGNVGNATFNAGGAGGIVQTIDWNGNVTWEYQYSSSTHLQHHDVAMLPDGNVLMIAWEYKTQAEAVQAGRDPSLLSQGELWADSVIEVQPTGSNTGVIVWEWHVWDHLVQDYDATKDNYGVVADHPERINLNYALNSRADWNHTNAIDYNAELDQILLSVHNFSEIWIIDHSTSTAEAASHSGGISGKGGDLLYRWGNPQAYGAGTASDQKLFVQHDAEWIDAGLSGEGNILIFNNGSGRPAGNYSSVDEIVPPLNPDGSYSLTAGSAYGPENLAWTYTADPPTDFYAQNISGAQRLPNGNTLICEGPSAYFFEVTRLGEVVWDYQYSGAVFRVERYAPNYAGFNGTPLDDE